MFNDLPKIEYLFFNGSIPDDIKELFEYSSIILPAKIITQKYIIYPPNLEIIVVENRSDRQYYPTHWSIYNYLKDKYPSIIRVQDEESDEMIAEMTNEIHQRIYLPVDDVKNLSIQTRSYQLNYRQIYEPSIPRGFGSQSWISLMIENKDDQKRIIGTYTGVVNIDESNRLYDGSSHIIIRQDYQGKRLCTKFVEFSYRNVIEKMKVQYIRLTVTANNKVNACRCYAQAAFNIGLSVYLDKQLISNRDDCSIYEDNPYLKMIIIADQRLKIDLMMNGYKI